MRPSLAALVALPLLAGCPPADPSEPHDAGFLAEADFTYPTGGAGPCAVDAGDLDGDGDLDLAISHLFSRTATLLLNDGAGHFSGAWVEWPQIGPFRLDGEGGVIDIADLDGDMAQDVLVTSSHSDELVILRNPANALGDREFEVSIIDVGSFPFGVVAAALDEAQGLDVAVSHGESNDLWVFPGEDGATLGAPTVYPSGGEEPGFVRAADIDGDGLLDLLTSNHSSAQMTVLKNLGGGAFDVADTYAVGAGPSSPSPLDLDGDGDLDIITANEEAETLSVMLNDAGTFSAGATIDTEGIPFYVQALDFDNDGDEDIAVPIEDTAEVAFFANDGGELTEVARTAVGSSPASIVAGDFDGDGDGDLVVTNFFSDTISVLLSQPAE